MADLALVSGRMASKAMSSAHKAAGAGKPTPGASEAGADGQFANLLDQISGDEPVVGATKSAKSALGDAEAKPMGDMAMPDSAIMPMALALNGPINGDEAVVSRAKAEPDSKAIDGVGATPKALAADVTMPAIALETVQKGVVDGSVAGPVVNDHPVANNEQVQQVITGVNSSTKAENPGEEVVIDLAERRAARMDGQVAGPITDHLPPSVESSQGKEGLKDRVQTQVQASQVQTSQVQDHSGDPAKLIKMPKADVASASKSTPAEQPLAAMATAQGVKDQASNPVRMTATADAAVAVVQSPDRQQPGNDGTADRDSSSPQANISVPAGRAMTGDRIGEALSTLNPFENIMQSLPPVLQAQLGGVAPLGQGQSPLMVSTADRLNHQVIDMGVSGQWIDRMAREITALADGTGHSQFQLSPPNLGRIQVDLWHGDDKTNVRLLTETDEAARRLREGQGALESSARLASLSLGSVTVEKSSAAFDSGRDANQGQTQRQGNDPSGQGQQQGSSQAQGQTTGGRRNVNHSGFAAVMGQDGQVESMPVERTVRADDPHVRFA